MLPVENFECVLRETQTPDAHDEYSSRNVDPKDGMLSQTSSNNEIHNAQPSSESEFLLPQDNNDDALRQGAMRELLEAEINYVNVLSAVCDGYLPVMSSRMDIFPMESIQLIFSNITSIYKFQQVFLDALRKGVEQNQVSKVFLNMHKGFLCYSAYCNAYSRAVIELATYDNIKDARNVLESCQASINVSQLPLSAHLLAPVQRICRYPLHLKNLMKRNSTYESGMQCDLLNYEQLDVFQHHVPDTQATVTMALQKMRAIIEAVNEGRRHSEIIAGYQASLQKFKGLQLQLLSSRFFIQTDATRLKHNLWNSKYILILFDRQLVYCKPDFIKRRQFVYKGRLLLDCCSIMNMRDGIKIGLHTVKNAIRIYCRSRNKWYDFSFSSILR
ncbi:rho guanine nucleotide exchange factor 4-like isoform X2 [Drosophila hydei]|nr:rho guanine nucleotide exchange factor 4-like isoform X2 [Drosophila hydei]